jgi:urea transporter
MGMATTSSATGSGLEDLRARLATAEAGIPDPTRAVLRGVGQVFFQDNALTGACFVVGIALCSPLMAAGAVVGSAIGYATARLAKYDAGETADGIYGFNPTLVGIASFFFFQLGALSVALMLVGSVVATLLTRLMRGRVPFPTYTTPFVVTTWAIHAIGNAMGAAPVEGYPLLVPDPPLPFVVQSVAHGVGQVMFQGSFWTALFFLVGIAIGNGRHAALVLAGSIVGMMMAWHHTTEATRAVDPERLVDRALFDNILLGLYGYNATLAPVALYLWRKSLIPVLLGMLLTVPIAELVPKLGVPALTAPFVLATWLVLLLGRLDAAFLHGAPHLAPGPGGPPPAG